MYPNRFNTVKSPFVFRIDRCSLYTGLIYSLVYTEIRILFTQASVYY